MTVCRVTSQANAIGKDGDVVCRYEWDKVKRTFRWNYYRGDSLIKGVSTAEKVISTMVRLVQEKRG